MPATGYLFQMAGGVPVVTAPAEIDTDTAGGLRAILVEWRARGHTTVVVDLTATRFCDSAGLRELVRAHKRAVADGGELRLVIPADDALLRVFRVTGLDGMIPHFATVTRAVAQVPAAAPASTPAHAAEHSSRAADSLTSSMAAMNEATARLPAIRVWDQPKALAAIGEAVWWITMVDATLVRHQPDAYDTVMAARTLAERELIVEALAGLLFVRNWIGREAGLGEIVETGAGARRITQWTWKPIGEPALAGLRPRAQAWELARYRAYQACLAGHTIGKTFGEAVAFLTLIGANATSSTGHRPLPSRAGPSC